MSDEVLKGVGGWLAILVVGLIFVVPIRELIGLVGLFGSVSSLPGWQLFKIWTLAMSLTVGGISIGAGVALLTRHQPSTVTFAMVALWVVGPGGIISLLLVMGTTLGRAIVDRAVPEMIGTVISVCITSVVWTAYLLRSRRVKNTYYSQLGPISVAASGS
jgi:uncharacterized membrane-anchored protein YitT (DUF2179 family)